MSDETDRRTLKDFVLWLHAPGGPFHTATGVDASKAVEGLDLDRFSDEFLDSQDPFRSIQQDDESAALAPLVIENDLGSVAGSGSGSGSGSVVGSGRILDCTCLPGRPDEDCPVELQDGYHPVGASVEAKVSRHEK